MKEDHLMASSPRGHRAAREAFEAGTAEFRIRAAAAPGGRTMKILNVLSGQAMLLVRSLKSGAKARKIAAPVRGRRVWDEHGNMLVETAIMFPVFLLALVGPRPLVRRARGQ